MLIDLPDATRATGGGKTAPLARLLRAGLPVPPGFVVPTCAYEQSLTGVDVAGAARQSAEAARVMIGQAVLPPALVDEIPVALARITVSSGDGYVAVRSSASTEDTTEATGAGQHDTVLAVRGPDQVAHAVRRCWTSLFSARAVAYRRQSGAPDTAAPATIAVLVQRLVDADVAGVMFTGTTTRIEASWGLGESVVSGRVTPDTRLVSDDGVVAHRAAGAKSDRIDRVGPQVETRPVPAADRDRPCLSDKDVLDLMLLGRRIENLLGRPQDVEWALADGQLWILQARPLTAALPGAPTPSSSPDPAGTDLIGTAASPGHATGPVRLVHGPGDFGRVQPGDVLVCRMTDPAWTVLFGVVAAVITEAGGLLSHAAIVAREHHLPAVLALPGAMTTLPDGAIVTVDGSNGRVTMTTD